MALTSVTVTATEQTTDTTVVVTWTADDDPSASWQVERSVNAGAYTVEGTIAVVEARTAVVSIADLADSDTLQVRISGLAEAISDEGDVITLLVPFDVDSYRLRQAALLYAMRNAKVMDAPLGVAGGFDIGQVYVGRIADDISRLLKGYRGLGVPSNQTWPTLADVKARLQATTTEADTFLQECLDSAIEQVRSDVAGAWGVA